VVDIKAAFEGLLKRELEKHGDPMRASEGLYAFSLDRQLEIAEALEALRTQPEPFAVASAQAARLFTENETLEVLTRERVLARREPVRDPPLELAREGNLERLRRVNARDLQLALQRARPLEAKVLIQAWNLLPLYEQERSG
jgi:hypothetical protein